MKINYCPFCGKKLELKEESNEGLVPYCDVCNKYIYDKYNVAVSLIVKCNDKYLLIKQYNKPDYILVAGYVKLGENIKDAALRELKEETSLEANSFKILNSSYYNKSDTLMINCLVEVNNFSVKTNYEIDEFNWFNKDEMLKNIKENSLAEKFVKLYVEELC